MNGKVGKKGGEGVDGEVLNWGESEERWGREEREEMVGKVGKVANVGKGEGKGRELVQSPKKV